MKIIFTVLALTTFIAGYSQTVKTYYFDKEYALIPTKDGAAFYADVTQQEKEKLEDAGKKKKKDKDVVETEIEVLHYEIYTVSNNLFYASNKELLSSGNDSIVSVWSNDKIRQISYYNDSKLILQETDYTIEGKLDMITMYKAGKADSIYEYYPDGRLQQVSIPQVPYNKTVYYFDTYGVKHIKSEEVELEENSSTNTQVFKITEKMPEFPGGDSELYKYLGGNVKYPREARDNGIQGKIYINFIVSETGEVTNFIIKRGVHPLLDFESLRALNKMPDWTPAEQQGKKVNVSYTLPVQFKLVK